MQESALITFQSIPMVGRSLLVVGETGKQVPFDVKRLYWIQAGKGEENRGGHAHKQNIQIIIALAGEIKIELENPEGKIFFYELKDNSTGLLIPPMYWRKIELMPQAVLLSLASEEYQESDYIRSYSAFKQK
jgi:hypothetical protein